MSSFVTFPKGRMIVRVFSASCSEQPDCGSSARGHAALLLLSSASGCDLPVGQSAKPWPRLQKYFAFCKNLNNVGWSLQPPQGQSIKIIQVIALFVTPSQIEESTLKQRADPQSHISICAFYLSRVPISYHWMQLEAFLWTQWAHEVPKPLLWVLTNSFH